MPTPNRRRPKPSGSQIAEASINVYRAVIKPGESVTESAKLGLREVAPGSASAWMIDLPDKMPCDKLILEVEGPRSGVRPVSVQAADEGKPRRDVLNQSRPEPRFVNGKT